jgi:hypothetical protein
MRPVRLYLHRVQRGYAGPEPNDMRIDRTPVTNIGSETNAKMD